MNDFVHRLYETGLATPGALKGCSESEILLLEKKYRLALPRSYRAFLSVMGHVSVVMSDLDYNYNKVLEFTARERNRWDAVCRDDPKKEILTPPTNALICWGRYNEQFGYLLCDGQDDSPLYYYTHEEPQPQQIFASFFDYLEDAFNEALRFMAKHRR